ncbi:hypothetical protein GQ473_07635 [archaeon]|nr:hypothetical protein [archaeon]
MVFDIADFQRRYNIPYFIDPHVHMRDEEWSNKAEMIDVYTKGAEVGIGLFFDMPNLFNPVITRERVKDRIRRADEQNIAEFYKLYVGLTADVDQIRKAVALTNDDEFGHHVIGLKLFAGESTGDLAVIDEDEQLKIYQMLAAEDYRGVVAVHCEKQEFIDGYKFNFDNPWTSWADARPGKAEYESVKDQIRFAKESEFKGTLHILHVSYADTIGLIREELKDEKLNITFELTPHHLLYSTENMRENLSWEGAMSLKCNPSIKDEENRKDLWDFLMNLPNDDLYKRVCIGTDYAPHGSDKLKPPYPSGVADYSMYGTLIDNAIADGLDESVFADLMYHNIVDIYGLNS